jgi:predicted pyridoxine 5'-phosphate oxidase superfamily flavin-nucleotide-binding protein
MRGKGTVMNSVLSSYPAPAARAVTKEISRLDEHCRAFLALCPFAVISTATRTGDPDVSPRGGEPGFLSVLDDTTLLLPDRPGNNRLDSLRKLADNPRVALLCMVPGIDETLRIYGRAELRDTAASPVDLLEHGRLPRLGPGRHRGRRVHALRKGPDARTIVGPRGRVPRSAFPSAGEVMRAHTGADGPVETDQEMRLRYQSLL